MKYVREEKARCATCVEQDARRLSDEVAVEEGWFSKGGLGRTIGWRKLGRFSRTARAGVLTGFWNAKH